MVFESIFAAINAAFDLAFAPILLFNPLLSLLFISTFLTVLVLVINRVFMNTKVMKEIKDKMEEIREQLTAAQKAGNAEESKKFLDSMMKTQSEQMKHTMKALVISLIVLSLFLPWIRYRYATTPVANLPFVIPFIGNSLNWFWWYVIASFTVGWVIKKLLAIDY